MNTPIQNLMESLLPFIDRSKVSDAQLQNIVEEHLNLEQETLYDAWDAGWDSSRKAHLNTDTPVTWYRGMFIKSTEGPAEPYLKEKAQRKNWLKKIL